MPLGGRIPARVSRLRRRRDRQPKISRDAGAAFVAEKGVTTGGACRPEGFIASRSKSCQNAGMQSIQLPDAQYLQLHEHALAAGYDSAEAFVRALAEEPTADPRGNLSEADLRQSAAECQRIHEQMRNGPGRDAKEALFELGNELGLTNGE
jgi:hypothetical protein